MKGLPLWDLWPQDSPQPRESSENVGEASVSEAWLVLGRAAAGWDKVERAPAPLCATRENSGHQAVFSRCQKSPTSLPAWLSHKRSPSLSSICPILRDGLQRHSFPSLHPPPEGACLTPADQTYHRESPRLPRARHQRQEATNQDNCARITNDLKSTARNPLPKKFSDRDEA